MSSPSEDVVCFHATIIVQGGNCFPVLSRKLEQFLSHIVRSQHSSRSSATVALVEPGALSTLMAFKQAQLRNLSSNLSAAQGWLYFVLKKHAPSWRVGWEGSHKQSCLISSSVWTENYEWWFCFLVTQVFCLRLVSLSDSSEYLGCLNHPYWDDFQFTVLLFCPLN